MDTAIVHAGRALAAVDRYVMAAARETRGQLFGKSLKAAVIGWYAARAEKGDAHRVRLRLGSLGAGEQTRDLLRRLVAHRRVLEPTRHVLVVYPLLGPDESALRKHALQIFGEKPERLQGRMLP